MLFSIFLNSFSKRPREKKKEKEKETKKKEEKLSEKEKKEKEVSASSVAILAEGSRRSLGHDDVDPCLCNGLQRRRVRTNASRFRENPDSASIAAS